MNKYYIHNGIKQEGPFSIEELIQKKIDKDTPVWYEGIDSWTTADKLEELRNTLKPGPPPFVKPQPKEQIPVQQKTVNNPPPQKSKGIIAISITVVIIALVIIGFLNFVNNPNSVPSMKFEINTPKPVVVYTNADNKKSDIKMRTTVYASVQNQGGRGNVLIEFHLTQDGNTYDRTKIITLNPGETNNVDVTFDEVRRLGGDIRYSVSAAAQ